MFGEDVSAGLGLSAVLAGAAATFSIAAFYFFLSTTAQEAKVKKRMAGGEGHRSAIRAATQSAIADAERPTATSPR